jgi:hypothetical protein
MKSAKLMIKVTDKHGKLQGYLTPEQLKQYYKVPKSSTRSLAEIVEEANKNSTTVILSLIIK